MMKSRREGGDGAVYPKDDNKNEFEERWSIEISFDNETRESVIELIALGLKSKYGFSHVENTGSMYNNGTKMLVSTDFKCSRDVKKQKEENPHGEKEEEDFETDLFDDDSDLIMAIEKKYIEIIKDI
ncbi:MAG: hypothetical protein ACRC5M_05150 [Anaeroplasmataceae bacterium]